MTHLDAIKIQESYLIGAGIYSFSRPNARVVGGYLATKGNVIKLGVPVRLVFAKPLRACPGLSLEAELQRHWRYQAGAWQRGKRIC